jgi:hypothetical protein
LQTSRDDPAGKEEEEEDEKGIFVSLFRKFVPGLSGEMMVLRF